MNQLNEKNWDYSGRNIVVTGATGLYGQELVKRLVDKGANVKTISRHPLGPGDFATQKQVTHLTGNLMDRSFAEHIMTGASGLFHFAGLRGSVGIQQSKAASLLHDNTLICFNTLEAARSAGLDKILYVSTVTVYPPLPEYHEHLMWSAPPPPAVEYVAWSKRMAEKLIEAYRVQYGLDNISIVRPVNTFGPHDDFNPQTALVIPALIKRAVDGDNPFVVWGDGSAIRDFLYVSDAIDGILLAFEKGCGMGAFNIGSG
ncbi:MAG: NAD-dependent epimerase/dehydratase family protein, partial [Planctomycetes bacterium]|nr:NAD-dependent epimerase/dehydratase family protein [Planctomycetota bacterium]